MLLTEVQTYSLTHLATAPFSSSVSVDHCFAFMTEKGIDILELAPDPRSLSPSLGCRRYIIKPPTSLATALLGIDPSELLPHLDKEDAYALITDVTVSPKLVRSTTPTPVPRAVQWSPRGILANRRCILSVLTDMGGLELFVVNKKVADISSLWLRHCCQILWSKPDSATTVSLLLQELRVRAEMVKITAMCWLGKAGELATVSKSGLVGIWTVMSRKGTTQNLEVTLTAKFDSELRNPTVLYWTTLTSERYLLTVGSSNGYLRGFTFPSTKAPSNPISDPITITPTRLDMWGEEDRIAPSHLSSWMWCDGHLFVAVKGAFLLTFYLDKQGNRLAYCAYRCSDISINGLSQVAESEILIVTRSARLSRLTVTLINDGSLNIVTEPVESYINVSHMGCYGLNMTLNKVICFILLSVNQSYDHLRLREPTQVVICSVSGLMDPRNVLQTPHKPVDELWDCLELLRVQILQKSVVPEATYSRAVLDTMTIDQLTVTLWWTTFTAAAEEDDTKHQTLLSLRREVEALVVSCHFFKRIASLLSCPTDSLTSFQLQSLGLVTKWLRQMQSLPAEFTTTLITARTLLQQLESLESHFPANELCSICGSNANMLASAELFMAECKNGHRLPRCSLSLVQCCQLPYYVCAQCGALGHPESVADCGASCYLCGGVLRIDEDILPR